MTVSYDFPVGTDSASRNRSPIHRRCAAAAAVVRALASDFLSTRGIVAS